jgi:hypothetical protein
MALHWELKRLDDQRDLRGEDAPDRLVRGEIPELVDLWEPTHSAGVRRPLHLELAGREVAEVQVGLDSPAKDELAASLAERRKGSQRATDLEPRLFTELADRRRQRRFPNLDEAFRNRPSAQIARPPERPTGMPEQDFRPVFPGSVHEDAGAHSHVRHHDQTGRIAPSQAVVGLTAAKRFIRDCRKGWWIVDIEPECSGRPSPTFPLLAFGERP